ncbi:hypothetical protein GlitD10_1644 [Gloeomargarita lithophora Alchichica-D10]|uniref:DUF29 domain-containing protein n=1 Tax=Gloeomargarita lithophora Alchichica-D10 TaxID=1188229 RepID=A0A1J0ADH8_9CYAN|nr:DUF29 domain-containing protein [Gloeomargarita lithophora]APB33968.1 hypothetical protein GlitD10_1644 [Gloeomargarita lithophora Alchichica-D10]
MDNTVYEKDFYRWTQKQANLLSRKQFDELDLTHLVEELQSLGNQHYDQLESRLIQLISHLLKWQIQHWRRSNSWRASIKVQRISIDKLLKRNPGLKPRVQEAFIESWAETRGIAMIETDLPEAYFPDACPFVLAEVMNPDFWPES